MQTKETNEALRANVSGIASRATPEARSFLAESGVAKNAFIPRTSIPGSHAKTDEPGTNPLSHWERTGLFTLLFVLFAFGLFDHSLWSSDDTREGAMIADMFRSGRWVTPVLNGESYLEKPPLLHWTGLVFCNLFGKVNEGLVRLPAAMYGFGAVLIAYLLGRKLGRERAGFAAAFMCGTSILFLEYSKVVITDIAVTFMVMFSLYLFWEAYTAQQNKTLKYIIFLVVSALSFYAKGFIGPGFVWVSVGLFLLYQKKWRLLVCLSLAFIPVFILALAPWVYALWKTGGSEYLKTVFWANQFGRFFSFTDKTLSADPYFVHKEPVYYYLKALPVSLLPWTLLLPTALLYWFRKDRGLDTPLHSFLRISLVSMMMILHASSAKVSCYALPSFPILFLMTAIWIEDSIAEPNSRIGNWVIGITTGLIIFISMLIPLLYIILLVTPQPALHLCLKHVLSQPIYEQYFQGSVDFIRITGAQSTYGGLVMAVLSLGLLAASTRELWARYRDGAHSQTWLMIPPVMTVILILNAETVIPAYDYQRTYKPFARLVRFEKERGVKIAVANTKEEYIGAFSFYLKSRLTIIPSPDKLKDFLLDKTGTTAVIIRTSELKTWLTALPECRFNITKANHGGYKCDYFRLIVHDPKTPLIQLQLKAVEPKPRPEKSKLQK